MIAREWKPGDVAYYDGTANGRMMRTREGWIDDDGEGRNPGGELLRPLIVIDAEDPAQVDRLLDAIHPPWGKWRCSNVDDLTEALREYANPTPTKPEEPGLIAKLRIPLDGKSAAIFAALVIEHPDHELTIEPPLLVMREPA